MVDIIDCFSLNFQQIPNSYNHITADTQDPDVVYIQPISAK